MLCSGKKKNWSWDWYHSGCNCCALDFICNRHTTIDIIDYGLYVISSTLHSLVHIVLTIFIFTLLVYSSLTTCMISNWSGSLTTSWSRSVRFSRWHGRAIAAPSISRWVLSLWDARAECVATSMQMYRMIWKPAMVRFQQQFLATGILRLKAK